MKKSFFYCAKTLVLGSVSVILLLLITHCGATMPYIYGRSVNNSEIKTDKIFQKKLETYKITADKIFNEDTRVQVTGYLFIKKKGLKVNILTTYINLKKIGDMSIEEAINKYQRYINENDPTWSDTIELDRFSYNQKVLFYVLGISTADKNGNYDENLNEFGLRIGENILHRKHIFPFSRGLQ